MILLLINKTDSSCNSSDIVGLDFCILYIPLYMTILVNSIPYERTVHIFLFGSNVASERHVDISAFGSSTYLSAKM